jgi:hypothetical protein
MPFREVVFKYIVMVIPSIKRPIIAMSGFVSNSDKDSLMRASYYQITRNFTKTVNRFVAFKDEDRLIEIPHGIGQRSKFIDLMIKYFESLEEYEKCNKLMKLKELVIMAGD